MGTLAEPETASAFFLEADLQSAAVSDTMQVTYFMEG